MSPLSASDRLQPQKTAHRHRAIDQTPGSSPSLHHPPSFPPALPACLLPSSAWSNHQHQTLPRFNRAPSKIRLLQPII
ncbi:hypothetical protein PGT21_015584 [Puccinia graminis f. sp. tritici]|uniref:Uncharacterized protein n=1 Tax=Puccinia graminis f. sp. tritici TaxID=56615 RepID=A0A5B0Q2H0_PUCGR|nr:hypothetical protein PGT21_015584 [Puccinia graminis f. sp. tritici]